MVTQLQMSDKDLAGMIQELIDKHADWSRRELARQVCKKLDWRRPTGKLKASNCRKLLSKLDRKDLIDLPAADGQWGFENHKPPAQTLPEGCAEFEGKLGELGEIHLKRVGPSGTKAYRIWRDMMDAAHPLGRGQLCGGQIRYLIVSPQEGYLGALAFSSPARRLKCREQHIRWTPEARLANREHIVQNSRFLILPQVRVGNLASHVLALARRRIVEDWHRQYGREVYMLETYVNPLYHRGSAYRADGWEEVGRTSGRGRQDAGHEAGKTEKIVFLRPTAQQWQQELCRRPCGTIQMLPEARQQQLTDWVDQELVGLDLGDKRLNRRARRLLRLMYAKPMSDIPETCMEDADEQAAYRFFENEKTDMDKVLEPHFESSIDRARDHDVVLAAQDSTSLNYSNLNVMEGMGRIHNTETDAQGVELHSTLLLTGGGLPLGFLDAICWAREGEVRDKNRLKEMPIEQKESHKWIASYEAATEAQRRLRDTRIISVGDRGSDIYDLFLRAKHTEEGAGLLVRAEKSRQRQTRVGDLWEKMGQRRVQIQMELQIPARAGQPSRKAQLAVRYGKVTLQPPKQKDHTEEVTMWAVLAREEPGEGHDAPEEPLEWMLLTTEPTRSDFAAKERIEQYGRRWAVEVFHRTLKSGCRMEDRQLQTEERMRTCLALDMIVAWRVYYLTMLGREMPEMPCTAFFTTEEWQGLIAFMQQSPEVPGQEPTISEMIQKVAKLGGHSQHKAPPGTETMWRGLQRLSDIARTYKAMQSEP
mgnify:CR=1 FL=1